MKAEQIYVNLYKIYANKHVCRKHPLQGIFTYSEDAF